MAGEREPETDDVRVYAGGGYDYPAADEARLGDELRWFLDHGYTHAKIKIGGGPLDRDLRRIEAAPRCCPPSTSRSTR